jgi:hypothetical protein
MEDTNIIQILDKIKKNLERGAVPIAINEIEATITMIERKIALAKGKRFLDLHIPQELPTGTVGLQPQNELSEIKYKINEIVRFLNERFPLS